MFGSAICQLNNARRETSPPTTTRRVFRRDENVVRSTKRKEKLVEGQTFRGTVQGLKWIGD